MARHFNIILKYELLKSILAEISFTNSIVGVINVIEYTDKITITNNTIYIEITLLILFKKMHIKSTHQINKVTFIICLINSVMIKTTL